MRHMITIILMLALPGVACAAGSFEQSDFIPRLVNFILFVAILWYFTFARIKAIFVNRRVHIASQLEEIQNKLHKAQREKADALKKLEESQARAQEIVEIAKKEASMISQRFAQQTQAQIQAMIQTMEASMEFEQAKAMREVVESILSEVVHSKDVQLENKDYVNIITKRIAS